MTIRSSIGVAQDDDLLRAIHDAAARACSTGDDAPRAALVLAAGAGKADALRAAAREAFGRIPIVGALVSGILTDAGVLESGAAVLCFHGDALVPSVASGGRGAGLSAATERAGRLILAGGSDRRHYPRGVALAFAGPGSESCASSFLSRWRQIAGPKLRTVFSATAGEALCGPGSEDPGDLAVLCLEGAHQSGVGVAGGFPPGDSMPDAATLVHGAADAATTAVKHLEGHPVRAALIAESAARHAALGSAARAEWVAMREQIGAEVPCLGWLTRAEGGSGRGVIAAGEAGSVIVAALGDAPAPPPRSS